MEILSKLIGEKIGQLTGRDLLKGFVVAMFTAILTGLYTSLSAIPPHLPNLIELKALGVSGLIAGIGYIIKQLITNSKDQLLKAEPKPNE